MNLLQIHRWIFEDYVITNPLGTDVLSSILVGQKKETIFAN